jgi:hypothetical protein
LFLDGGASEEEREEAWRALEERVRRPVLQELRRHMEGRRLVERLADQVCGELRDACEGLGGGEPRLRLRVAEEVRRLLHERQAEGDVGEEFDKDWAGSLLLGALTCLKNTHPQAHQLLIRLYDRPAGGAPLSEPALAAALGRPTDLVQQDLEEGRKLLRQLFEGEIALTVAEVSMESEERARLLPYVAGVFERT